MENWNTIKTENGNKNNKISKKEMHDRLNCLQFSSEWSAQCEMNDWQTEGRKKKKQQHNISYQITGRTSTCRRR